MALFLEVITGEKQGQRYLVKRGVVMGRSRSDILLTDKKVSARHASIELKDDGLYYLTDLGSSNKIKYLDKKVSEVCLTPDVEFSVGNIRFKVIEANDDRIPEYDTWNVLLARLARRAQQTGENQAADAEEVKFFEKPVKLSFVGGLQTGQEWVIAYGPRWIGGKTLDCFLEDLNAPDLAFKLTAVNGGVFINAAPNVELAVNGQKTQSKVLNQDDVIEFDGNKIRVTYDSV